MSTIKSSAENLTLNADGANNDIIFQSNGSNVATLDQAGLLTATTFAGSGASLTGITTGKVLQVVSVEKSDTFTTTSTSFVDITGLSVSITPSATTSKILVLMDVSVGNTGNTYTANVRLMRGATAISIGDSAGSRSQSTGNTVTSTYIISSIASNPLDSPSTTSATTYKIQARAEAASTTTINRSGIDNDNSYTARTTSHITLMEIGA